MSGPGTTVLLADRIGEAAVDGLASVLGDISVRLEVRAYGDFDLNIEPAALGVTGAERVGAQPYCVVFTGPGFPEKDVFGLSHMGEAENLEPLIGFQAVTAMDVFAMCSGRVNQVLTALLTARVMDVFGGVAEINVFDEDVELVLGLQGLLAMDPGGRIAYGTAEFVRAWVAHPEFRMPK